MDTVLLNHTALADLFNTIFKKLEVTYPLYKYVTAGLIQTSLRGVDSHGIRLMLHYISALQSGRINKHPHITFKKTAAAAGILDADHAFGMIAGTFAMKKAVTLAKKSGIGVVVVQNSSHFGAAAIFSLIAAKQNMIGVSMTHTDSLVVPFGGKKPFLGTNPICFAAPCDGEDPFCLDMATTGISWNKLLMYRNKKMTLPTNVAADKDGNMSTDPFQAVALLPIAGYKGYGLALMIEILCSVLTGMPYGTHINPMYPLTKDRRYLGHFFLAIDIAKFEKINVFKKRMRMLLEELRTSESYEKNNTVKVAGDPEKETYKKRIAAGVSLSLDDFTKLSEIAISLGINKRLLEKVLIQVK